MPHVCECPKCGVDISDTYQSAEPDVGIMGSGWWCEACDKFVDDDDDGSEAPAPSPFLPGTYIQYAWDSTSIGYLKTCPRLYQYVMIEGWGSADESIHLRFGIEFHKALQDLDVYLAEGLSRPDAIRRIIHELLSRTYGWVVDEDTKAGKYKNRWTLVRTVIDYVDFYANDPAKTYIMANGKPAVELSGRFELDWGPSLTGIPGGNAAAIDVKYILCFHLDRVVEFNEELYTMDRKTTTILPTAFYFAQFNPNNQMSLYTLAGQVILNTTIKGVIIDAAQILVESSRFQRGTTFRTKDQLEEWLTDLSHWLNLAERYATEGYWPQNDTACDKFGGCRFREICSKSPQVRGQFLKSRFTKLPPEERWNPLKSR